MLPDSLCGYHLRDSSASQSPLLHRQSGGPLRRDFNHDSLYIFLAGHSEQQAKGHIVDFNPDLTDRLLSTVGGHHSEYQFGSTVDRQISTLYDGIGGRFDHAHCIYDRSAISITSASPYATVGETVVFGASSKVGISLVLD